MGCHKASRKQPKTMRSILVIVFLQLLLLVHPLLGGKHKHHHKHHKHHKRHHNMKLGLNKEPPKTGKGKVPTTFLGDNHPLLVRDHDKGVLGGKHKHHKHHKGVRCGASCKRHQKMRLGLNEDPPKTGKGKVPKKGKDYALSADQCEGLKKLCKGRSSCLEAIKCDGGSETYNQTALQDGAPEDGAPQEAQQDGAPEDGAPEDGAPQNATQYGAPQNATQDGASDGTGQTRHNEFIPMEHKRLSDGAQQDGAPEDGSPQDGAPQDGAPEDG